MKKLTGVRKSARRRTKKSELVYGEIPVTKELLEPQNVFSSIERSKAQYPMGSDHLEDGRRYLSPDVFIKVHNESEPSPVRFDYNSAPLSARLLGISPEPTENRYINAAKEKKKLYHRMNDFIPTESIPVYEYDQHGPIPMDKYPAFEKPTFILADSPFNG